MSVITVQTAVRSAGAASLFVVGLWAGAGLGSAEPDVAAVDFVRLSAQLNVGQEVPKPSGTKTGAGGNLTGTLAPTGGSRRITWRLTFRNLSGKAAAAHIHAGKRGRSGPVVISLRPLP